MSRRYDSQGHLVRETPYRNEKKNGVERYYVQGRLRWEMEHWNGTIEGTARRFDDKGNPVVEYQYENGILKNSFSVWLQSLWYFLRTWKPRGR